MRSQTTIPDPLVVKILDQMFANLARREESDEQTIQALKKLARNGHLKRPIMVTQAIQRESPATK